jgi:hypothetical protein
MDKEMFDMPVLDELDLSHGNGGFGLAADNQEPCWKSFW